MFALVENGLAPIAQEFRKHVEAKGNAIVDQRVEELKQENLKKSEALTDPTFIQSLLDLHDRYKSIV